MNKYKTMALISLLSVFSFLKAQDGNSLNEQLERALGEERLNTITTAVPFLMIGPDSRSGAMGDVGAATKPGVFSSHWNGSKLAFIESDIGVGFSYIPWLRNLVPDISLSYLSGFKRINKQATVYGSFKYFTLGDITLTDEIGNTIQNVNPNEFAIDGGIAYKLSDFFSGGFSLRYVFSDLTRGVSLGGDNSPANAVAADLSGFYSREIEFLGYVSNYNFGFNISNIGNKVSYSEAADRDFIPINLRLGNGIEMNLDDYNTLGVYLDINKLLVPTSPIFANDTTNPDGSPLILAGKDPDVSVPVGMIQSFYDAPGGFSEEFNELTWSAGLEYWYDQQFAMRGGFFYEHPNKGSRQYVTVGAGVKYEMLFIDFSYLVPIDQRNPLENTVRFSLSLDISELNKKSKPKEN